MITVENFTRVSKDVNGNPRYVIHFLDLITEFEYEHSHDLSLMHTIALTRARKLGGKKYRGKDFGGGIVFQSDSLPDTVNRINELLNSK